tara:strand:+ start:1333 stop:3444 length:2112 start_codon:yes stop_codon:yes gene_type:complete
MALGTPETIDLDATKQPINFVKEGKDVPAENRELSDLVNYIEGRFSRAKTARDEDEQRWLVNYRNYRGLYGPEVQFTDTEKSKAFVKITKTKVLAAYAQISDVLFAGGKFPIGVEPTSVVSGGLDAVNIDAQQKPEELQEALKVKTSAKRKDILERTGPYRDRLERVEDLVEEGASGTPGALIYEPAKEAARRMEKLIFDQLEECEASKHLRSMAFEMALFGTGVIKGPFAYDKEYPRWNQEGEYDPVFSTIAKVEHCSVWDFYPDPESRSMSEAEYVVHRHRMSRSQLRNLKNRPMFRDESIEEAIVLGPNYTPEYWEQVLEDSASRNTTERYEVLEFWGFLDSEIAEEAGIVIPDDFKDVDQVQVNCWICNGQTLRLVLNPFVPSRIPYHASPYEANPYSFFGVGIAENMADTQLIMNGMMRMAIDNAALSGNLLIEIDETNLTPGQSMDVYPGKVFRRQAGAPGQAIFGTKFPNVSNELLMMFDKARQLADESTGLPSYSHGSTGVMSTGRTASGMSMLMGAAAGNIKAVVKNIDDYLLAPLGKSLFSFNMQFNFSEDLLGDLEVVSKGTESLMRNEIRSQRLLQFMQMAANPVMSPFVRFDYILRELATSMDLDEDKILNDAREAAIQAKMMADLQSMQPQTAQPGTPPGGPPNPEDPTGTGGGNIAPGNAPEPGAPGNTGAGGGDNMEGAPPPPLPQG